jgi:hypothetical protein
MTKTRRNTTVATRNAATARLAASTRVATPGNSAPAAVARTTGITAAARFTTAGS